MLTNTNVLDSPPAQIPSDMLPKYSTDQFQMCNIIYNSSKLIDYYKKLFLSS